MRKKTFNKLLGLVVALFTAAGAFKALEHHTTALLFFLAAVALSVVTVLIWFGRQISKLPLRKRPTPDEQGGTQPSTFNPPWTEYTQDVFTDISSEVIWRWHYRPEIDNMPRNIAPFCPECRELSPLRISHSSVGTRRELVLSCTSVNHVRLYSMPAKIGPHLEMFPDIKERIQQRLADGSWVEVVNKHRLLKGEVLIAAPVRLEEIPTYILKALAMEGGQCDEFHLNATLDFLLTNAGEPKVDRVAIKYHLEDLEKQKRFIWMTHSPGSNEITLTQTGRKYVLDNNL